MESYHIHIPKSIKKDIEKIPLPWRERISRTIDMLITNPYLGSRLSTPYKGRYKIKVWPYRIVYMIDHKQKWIIVVEVKHRGSVSYA